MQLKLVSPKEEYAELFYLWRTQPTFIKHNPLKLQNLEECRARLLSEGDDLQSSTKCEAYRWFIELGGEIVGSVSVSNRNEMMKIAEIGYAVDERFQGKGIGSLAVGMLVTKVFAETDLRKLIAFVHDLNIPSCRLLEKVGFKKEGLLRQHYLINQKPENEVLYGLLREEIEAP